MPCLKVWEDWVFDQQGRLKGNETAASGRGPSGHATARPSRKLLKEGRRSLAETLHHGSKRDPDSSAHLLQKEVTSQG